MFAKSADYHVPTSKRLVAVFDIAAETSRTIVQPTTAVPIGTTPTPHRAELLPLYLSGEPISGRISLKSTQNGGRPLQHSGLSVELVYVFTVDGHPESSMHVNCMEVEPTGYIPNMEDAPKDLTFDFGSPTLPYETYHGKSARCQLFVRLVATIGRKLGCAEQEICVFKPGAVADGLPIRESVAITDPKTKERTLNISFMFKTNSVDLNGCLEGSIAFNIIKIPIDSVTCQLIRRETIGLGIDSAAGPQSAVTSDKFELGSWDVMEGVPAPGTVVPVRIYLERAGRDAKNEAEGSAVLTPTLTAMNNRFNVRYFLVIMLSARGGQERFMKQYEIHISRTPSQIL